MFKKILSGIFGDPEAAVRFPSMAIDKIENFSIELPPSGTHPKLGEIYLSIDCTWIKVKNSREYAGASLNIGGGIRVHGGSSQNSGLSFSPISEGTLKFCRDGLAFSGVFKSRIWDYSDFDEGISIKRDAIIIPKFDGESETFLINPDLTIADNDIIYAMFVRLQIDNEYRSLD